MRSEKMKFIDSLMYENRPAEIYSYIKELEDRISKLPHCKFTVKLIDLEKELIVIKITIDKINISFERIIRFERISKTDLIEHKIKAEIKKILELYYGV